MSESTTPYQPGKHGPVRLSSATKADPKYAEREPLFYIDDDEYTILKTPSPALGLRFLELARQRGEVVATAQMFDEVVGAGVLRKLSKMEGITEAETEAIMGVVADKLTAAATAATGN